MYTALYISVIHIRCIGAKYIEQSYFKKGTITKVLQSSFSVG